VGIESVFKHEYLYIGLYTATKAKVILTIHFRSGKDHSFDFRS